MLKMQLVGAIEGVSGSCTWLHHTESNTQFLVDCGLHQGDVRETWFNNQPFAFSPAQIRYVLLTHAHIDHCGLLPRLVREGFSGLVYATRATCELARLMLMDASRVAGTCSVEEVERINWSPIDDDPGFKWGRQIRLAEGLRMAFLRSSHILGACSVSIAWKVETPLGKIDKTICFSGDVGCQTDENPYLPLMKGGHNPFAKSDYLVVEATYGNRLRAQEHQSSDARLSQLGQIIRSTVFDKGGRVLIPAFSLHRSQELLLDVLTWMRSERLLSTDHIGWRPGLHATPFTVTLHAPLGRELTKVYAEHLCSRSPNGKLKYLNEQLEQRLGLGPDEIREMLKELIEKGSYKVSPVMQLVMVEPGQSPNFHSDVVIASSGMCDHGPAVAYLKEWEGCPANTIILTGYQSSGSRGAALQAKALHTCDASVMATTTSVDVVDMSGYYSAHGDQNMLLDYIFRTDGFGSDYPATVFLNHGSPDSKYGFQEAIQSRASMIREGDRRVTHVCIADARAWNLNTGRAIDDYAALR